jgi:hypothetical protein
MLALSTSTKHRLELRVARLNPRRKRRDRKCRVAPSWRPTLSLESITIAHRLLRRARKRQTDHLERVSIPRARMVSLLQASPNFQVCCLSQAAPSCRTHKVRYIFIFTLLLSNAGRNSRLICLRLQNNTMSAVNRRTHSRHKGRSSMDRCPLLRPLGILRTLHTC